MNRTFFQWLLIAAISIGTLPVFCAPAEVDAEPRNPYVYGPCDKDTDEVYRKVIAEKPGDPSALEADAERKYVCGFGLPGEKLQECTRFLSAAAEYEGAAGLRNSMELNARDVGAAIVQREFTLRDWILADDYARAAHDECDGDDARSADEIEDRAFARVYERLRRL